MLQNVNDDYTIDGSTITFTTAPADGLTFFGTFLGQALSLNTVQDGTVEFFDNILVNLQYWIVH